MSLVTCANVGRDLTEWLLDASAEEREAMCDAMGCVQDFITENTDTVILSGDGTNGNPLQADVEISGGAGNALEARPDGLYAAGGTLFVQRIGFYPIGASRVTMPVPIVYGPPNTEFYIRFYEDEPGPGHDGVIGPYTTDAFGSAEIPTDDWEDDFEGGWGHITLDASPTTPRVGIITFPTDGNIV